MELTAFNAIVQTDFAMQELLMLLRRHSHQCSTFKAWLLPYFCTTALDSREGD